MERATQVRIMRELLRQMDANRNVDAGQQVLNPASAYVDPEQARAEWDTFFRGHPQLIGLSGDLPGPDTYMTIATFGVPVVATRDAEGRFHAFVNACRHRGAQVAPAGRGRARQMTCPFHNWVYRTDGRLVGVPRSEDFGPLDRDCRGLVELPAVERYGMLYVHPVPGGAIDVDDLLGGLAPELEAWDLGALHHVGVTRMENRLNWKLAIDTFGETYHLTRLHSASLGRRAQGDVTDFEPFGRNHRFCAAMRSLRKLSMRPEGEWRFGHVVNLLYFLFPNVHLNVLNREFALIRIYPAGPDPSSTVTEVTHYVDDVGRQRDERIRERMGDKVALPSERVAATLTEVIDAEDYRTCEATQRSAESGLLPDLIFGRNEPALQHYHRGFREALGQPPLQVLGR